MLALVKKIVADRNLIEQTKDILFLDGELCGFKRGFKCNFMTVGIQPYEEPNLKYFTNEEIHSKIFGILKSDSFFDDIRLNIKRSIVISGCSADKTNFRYCFFFDFSKSQRVTFKLLYKMATLITNSIPEHGVTYRFSGFYRKHLGISSQNKDMKTHILNIIKSVPEHLEK